MFIITSFTIICSINRILVEVLFIYLCTKCPAPTRTFLISLDSYKERTSCRSVLPTCSPAGTTRAAMPALCGTVENHSERDTAGARAGYNLSWHLGARTPEVSAVGGRSGAACGALLQRLLQPQLR